MEAEDRCIEKKEEVVVVVVVEEKEEEEKEEEEEEEEEEEHDVSTKFLKIPKINSLICRVTLKDNATFFLS